MTKQHSPDKQTLPGRQQRQHRHDEPRESTRTKQPMSARLTPAAILGTLLAMLIWGVLPYQPQAQIARLDSGLSTTVAATGTKYDHNSDVHVVITSFDSSPIPPIPPIPVVPQPVLPLPRPVLPQPVLPLPQPQPTPVFPRPVPVLPQPTPVFPRPVPVLPHPIPVFPHPRPVFPHPVVPLDQVPDLVGDDLATAEQLLAQNGLAVGSITYQPSDQPAGTILQTSPEPDTTVSPGTAISLVVAE